LEPSIFAALRRPVADFHGLPADQGQSPTSIGARQQLWVKLGRELDVRAESAFPTFADIVEYGRDLRRVFIRSWLRVYEFTP
jgi:hypothetical protein